MRLVEAIQWLNAHGVIPDYVNENAPDRIQQYGGDTRKISADFYIDDKIVGEQIDWLKICREILKQEEEHK